MTGKLELTLGVFSNDFQVYSFFRQVGIVGRWSPSPGLIFSSVKQVWAHLLSKAQRFVRGRPPAIAPQENQ